MSFFSIYEKVTNLPALEKAYRLTWLFGRASISDTGKMRGRIPG
jgi:hypothetical protein